METEITDLVNAVGLIKHCFDVICVSSNLALCIACRGYRSRDESGGALVTDRLEFDIFLKPHDSMNEDCLLRDVESSRYAVDVRALRTWAAQQDIISKLYSIHSHATATSKGSMGIDCGSPPDQEVLLLTVLSS